VNGEQQRHVFIVPPNALDNVATIHGIILDEGVSVAPDVPGGCTVVHLTTTIPSSAEDSFDETVLERALNAVLAGSTGEVDEIFHVTYSYGLEEDVPEVPLAGGVHTVRRDAPGFEADPAFEQAASIFSSICPHVDFLTMSKEMDEAVKERIGDSDVDDDDEQRVLASAMGMIQHTEADEQQSTVS